MIFVACCKVEREFGKSHLQRILCETLDRSAPQLKKVLTREFRAWHGCHALNSRVSSFLNTGEKFRKVFDSL